MPELFLEYTNDNEEHCNMRRNLIQVQHEPTLKNYVISLTLAVSSAKLLQTLENLPLLQVLPPVSAISALDS